MEHLQIFQKDTLLLYFNLRRANHKCCCTDQGDRLKLLSNTTSRFLGNPDLKPERLDELEFGLEGRFFDNRINLDFSIYKRITKDLIVNRPTDPTSGFDVTRTNIGEIENDGIEIDLTYDVIRSDGDGLNWSANFNWSTSEAIVTDLGLDTDIVVFAGFTNRGNAAITRVSLGNYDWFCNCKRRQWSI